MTFRVCFVFFFGLSCPDIYGTIAPDRAGKVAKFNADAYAVLEATAAQGTIIFFRLFRDLFQLPYVVQQNQLLESKIMRHPSRTTSAKKVEKLPPAGLVRPSGGGTLPSSQVLGSAVGSVPLSTSLGPSSGHGPQIFLKIKVEDTVDAVHISTTIEVSVLVSFLLKMILNMQHADLQRCICKKFSSLCARSVNCRIQEITHFYWFTTMNVSSFL